MASLSKRSLGLSLFVALCACSAPEPADGPGVAPLTPTDDQNLAHLDATTLEQLSSVLAESAEFEVSIPNIADLTDDTYFVGGDWPLGVVPVWKSGVIPEGATPTIVIVLEGGPLAPTVSQSSLRKLARIYPPQNHSVYAIRYSASLEWNAERLRRHGLEAFTKDSAELVKFAGSLKSEAPDAKLVLHASSLSALLAIECVSSAEGLFDALVLISPWTHYLAARDFSKNPFSIFDAGEFKSRAPEEGELRKRYLATTKEYFGIDESLSTDPGREWMQDIRARSNFGSTATIAFFGEYEDRVPLREAEHYLSGHGAKVITTSYHYHGTVMTSDGERTILRDFISEISRAD